MFNNNKFILKSSLHLFFKDDVRSLDDNVSKSFDAAKRIFAWLHVLRRNRLD